MRGREETPTHIEVTMFTNNPFAALTDILPASFMQVYVILMFVAVVAGTLFDVVHKGSAKYFFNNWRKSKSKEAKQIGGGEWVSLAVQTGLVDVLASGEFCNARRRVAHLLTMYGFLIYIITTAIMVFGYPTPATPTPAILPLLWWIGGLMVCLGGYWFWFFIRADVAAEGNSPLRVMRADLFILALLSSVTLGLIWAFLQTRGGPGPTRSSACTSSPRRCCSDRYRGPSSLTCFSSPRRPSKKGLPTRTAPEATCPRPPTSPSCSAAPVNNPGTTNQLHFGRQRKPCQHSFT